MSGDIRIYVAQLFHLFLLMFINIRSHSQVLASYLPMSIFDITIIIENSCSTRWVLEKVRFVVKW